MKCTKTRFYSNSSVHCLGYSLMVEYKVPAVEGLRSTFYSMFEKRSAVKIEYICEFCRVLDISVAQLIDEKNSKKYLTPVQIELLEEFEGLDDAMIRRIIPMVKGIIFSEKCRQ